MAERLLFDRLSRSQRELALTLARLRACAIAGQAATVVLISQWLGFSVSLGGLAAGIGALAAFEALAWWRLKQPWPVGEAEVVGHLAVDISVLCYLLYLTGGATNPFISLYVVPVALAATALSARYLAAVVLLCAGAYALLMTRYVPLPAMHLHDANSPFSVHVLGMGINFAISASVLSYFVWRLARTLRERETAIQRERERALRDAGILAIATQAAGAAHELNTPLSTMRTLIVELCRERADDTALADDLILLAGQAERCRDILRELVALGTAQLNETPQAMALEAFATGCAERFRLLRPETELAVRLGEGCRGRVLHVAPGLQHALVALLNNAADASAVRRCASVEFSADCAEDTLEFGIRDHGPGATGALGESRPQFVSSKRDGLGLGLALANATAERLGGGIVVDAPDGGGTLTRLRLPLASLEDARHA
ncbi:MAG TPA: ATP-binding protein [Rudaea sp.]|nr:ATP-binding protein [Rudaea sp.]